VNTMATSAATLQEFFVRLIEAADQVSTRLTSTDALIDSSTHTSSGPVLVLSTTERVVNRLAEREKVPVEEARRMVYLAQRIPAWSPLKPSYGKPGAPSVEKEHLIGRYDYIPDATWAPHTRAVIGDIIAARATAG
jgi:hypothetical protein